jgi:hypothetical protein
MATVQFAGIGKVVETLAQRDAITMRPDGLQVQVNDTAGDPAAENSPAVYRWVKKLNKWILAWKSAKTPLAFISGEAIIANDQVVVADPPGSGVVWDTFVTSLDKKTIIAEVEVTVSDRTITLHTDTAGQFDGQRFTYKYATGDVDGNQGQSRLGNLDDLNTTIRDNVVAAVNDVSNKLALEVGRREADINDLQNALAAVTSGMHWRDPVVVITTDARLQTGWTGGAAGTWSDIPLSNVLPLADDDLPSVVTETNFSEGSYLVVVKPGSGLGSQGHRLMQIVTVDGVKTITLAEAQFNKGDFFIVANNLLNSTADTEIKSIFWVSGTTPVKVCDLKWEYATGITLSSGFTETAGTVLAGDSVQAAISKIVANLKAEIDRATAVELVNGQNIQNLQMSQIPAIQTRLDGIDTTLHNILNGAPEALNTLAEIATQLQNDENAAAALVTAVAAKEPAVAGGLTAEFYKGNKTWAVLSSSDVTTALGFVPYNGTTNPNNYATQSQVAAAVSTAGAHLYAAAIAGSPQAPSVSQYEGNIAIGNSAMVQSSNENGSNLAIGSYCTIVEGGSRAVAVGTQNTAGPGEAIAIGIGNFANAHMSLALGYSNTVDAVCATAVGLGNSANQEYAIAIGYQSTAGGYGSIAVGRGNTAAAQNSVALGNNSKTINYGQLAFSTGGRAVQGDTQCSTYLLFGTTTSAAATGLFLDGNQANIGVDLSQAISYRITAVGHNTTTPGQNARIETVTNGLVYNNEGVLAHVNPTWNAGSATAGNIPTVTVTVNGTTLAVKVAINSTDTYHWVLKVETVETTN